MMGMFNIGALHSGANHGLHEHLSQFLYDKLGRVGEFIDEVMIHGILDTLKLVLFLFLTYLHIEPPPLIYYISRKNFYDKFMEYLFQYIRKKYYLLAYILCIRC